MKITMNTEDNEKIAARWNFRVHGDFNSVKDSISKKALNFDWAAADADQHGVNPTCDNFRTTHLSPMDYKVSNYQTN